MYRSTLTSKGQITVPADVRELLGLKQGDGVVFEVKQGYAVFRRQPALSETLRRIAAEPSAGRDATSDDEAALRERFARRKDDAHEGRGAVYLCRPGRCVRLGPGHGASGERAR